MAMKADEGKKHERVTSHSGAAAAMSSVAAGTDSRPEKLELEHMRRASAESVVARCVGSMFEGATRLMRMANELVSGWSGAMT